MKSAPKINENDSISFNLKPIRNDKLKRITNATVNQVSFYNKIKKLPPKKNDK